jgi:hypothetical protein
LPTLGGLLALSVGVGWAVLQEMMEWEVDRVVGPKAVMTSTRSLSATAIPGVPA